LLQRLRKKIPSAQQASILLKASETFSSNALIMPSATNFLSALLLLPVVRFTNGQLFTVNCSPLTIQRSDPIISPGIASSHVHAIIGGSAFQRTMSATTAVNAKLTTCDKKLDKSNYWVPQLYHIRSDGKFEIVEFQGSVSGGSLL
jgi:hypothetical protein